MFLVTPIDFVYCNWSLFEECLNDQIFEMTFEYLPSRPHILYEKPIYQYVCTYSV